MLLPGEPHQDEADDDGHPIGGVEAAHPGGDEPGKRVAQALMRRTNPLITKNSGTPRVPYAVNHRMPSIAAGERRSPPHPKLTFAV